MATRSLTEVFVLMRNNAIQNRHIYSEQKISDRVALVDHDEDVELGRIPPSWTSAVEETQYTSVRLKSKLVTLAELHAKSISRPTLDDSTQEEQQIDSLTQEISRMFNSSHRLVSQIRAEGGYAGSRRERNLATSVAMALVTNLQSLSQEFRTLQSNYLSKLNMREERSRAYFEVDLNDRDDETGDGDWLASSDLNSASSASGPTVDSFQQLLQLEMNSKDLALRDKEVQHIVKSIVELNGLFKDLGQMVIDQGTVLDRIDYNIEVAQVEVEQATRELRKAAAHQRSSRKIVCILILGTVTSLMTALLIIEKL